MSSSRQTICTHSSVTRVFDSSERQKCDTCGQPSRMGWVYICTEDHDSWLPNHEAAGFFSAPKPTVLKHVQSSTDSPQLNTWVNKAVEDGHYTPKQVEVLKAQRANLRRTVSSIVAISTDYNPITQLFEQLKNTHITPPDDEEEVVGVMQPAKPEKKETLSLAVPACRHRCCPACRPLTRDRAWVSLNRACDDDNYARGTPAWELQNRRISNLSVVRKLGLHDTDPPTPLSTSSKRATLTLNEPETPKSDSQSTPTKRTPRRSYEAVRRPSVGRRIPLKRTLAGSFSRGREGLLFFGNENPTGNGMHKNTRFILEAYWF